MLPTELINYILTYNIHPCAEIMNTHYKNKIKQEFARIEGVMNAYGNTYSKIYLGMTHYKRIGPIPFTFLRFILYRMCFETESEAIIKFSDHVMDCELWDPMETAGYYIKINHQNMESSFDKMSNLLIKNLKK